MPSKSSSSAQDEIEIEIAEVLYGMMRQPQGPSKQEIMANDSIKLESRETNNKSTSDTNKSSGDAKSRVSSPISSSQYGVHQSSRSSQPAGEPAWALCVGGFLVLSSAKSSIFFVSSSSLSPCSAWFL